MSSNKIQKPKTAKLKKKEDEDEDMNDDNEGSSQNYKPKKKPTLQSKKKVRGRGDSFSSDGTGHKKKAKGRKPSYDEEDENDDEDEDEDEESYDDEDDEEGSFIAPEEEVEREIKEQKKRELQEYRKEKKMKDIQLKRDKDKVIDSEDEEIINANLESQRQGKKKRLTKNIDKEAGHDQVKSEDMFVDQQRSRVKEEDQHYERNPSQYQNDKSMYLQDQQQRGVEDDLPISTSRNIQLDEEVYHERNQSNALFKDSLTLRDDIRRKVLIKPKDQEDDFLQPEGLEEMFDGQEIDDQFATKQDDIIANTDIPERLQLLIGNKYPPLEQFEFKKQEIMNELAEETKWIFERLEKEKIRNFDKPHEVQEKIQLVLECFRIQKYDIPMIMKHRKSHYRPVLEENDVQLIFNLDIEFGKFKLKKEQILSFLRKIQNFENEVMVYEEELAQAKDQFDLNFFSPLISFYKSYYQEELLQIGDEDFKKRNPMKSDKIFNARKYKLDDFAKFFVLSPTLFCENLQHMKLINKPPENLNTIPFHKAKEYLCDGLNEEITVFSSVCEYQAIQLAAQPYIRQSMKVHFYNCAHITTAPTEKGNKELDVFHPSYRVKRVNKRCLSDFHPRFRTIEDTREKKDAEDLFIDILQNEKNGLISVQIQIDKEMIERYQNELSQLFLAESDDQQEPWNIMRKEIIRRMYEHVLYPEMVKEARSELQEIAENFIIKRAQEKYKELLMTGPFNCEMQQSRTDQGQEEYGQKGKKKHQEEEVVKDRPRCNVMGVIYQQIDYQNHMVTVAVVNKYGNLMAHKDFMHLMPPREITFRQGADIDEERKKKIQLTAKEERKEHEDDRDKVAQMMQKYQIDLVVVGASKLDSRKIKEVFKDIAEKVKCGDNDSDEEINTKRSKKRNDQEEFKKEAFVIWGCLEVPKLFASSHKSMKILKNCSQNLKQAVSLARFEQDPMCEILNLWSSVPSENQTLSLNLHPLQKLINQAKLASSLEEINVYCVNLVGIDFNVLKENDHMHCLLQFISGLGPRKAKKLLKTLNGRNIYCRKELLENQLLPKNCYISAISFIKIKVPYEDRNQKPQDYLDLTRIHIENYFLARKITVDVMFPNAENISENDKSMTTKNVMKNPSVLDTLDLKALKNELNQGGFKNMISFIDNILEELRHPFRDPRRYRDFNTKVDPLQLLYWLIDETERTFKRGIIVNATVVKVLDKKILCKLDNGLDGIINKEDIGSSENEKFEDFINHVITGRIDKIKSENVDGKYSVELKCKREDLEKHDRFVENRDQIPKEDLVNQNFQIKDRKSNQSLYVPRRINHLKFKNTTAGKAIQELADKENGEFLFRPSSKGTDNINLTWKFHNKNLVHIDIVESDKPPGASIGNKLRINDEEFENLQEIVERYIIPCNRALKEVIQHPKFKECESEEEFQAVLREEKKQEPAKIPYRFTILPEYPQHVVLGYMAKNEKVDKEFIKVKPRGFYFHEKYHKPFQSLINWYKENFRTRDYQKMKQRYDKRPPLLRMPQPNREIEERKNSAPQMPMEWQPKGGDSVHSLNDERQESNTPYQIKTENYGRATSEIMGGSSRTGALTGAQFSEYNTNIQPQMSESYGRGRGPPSCFNCQEIGHVSKDCPNNKKSFGRGASRDHRNDVWNREKSEESKEDPAWGNQKSEFENRQASQEWGATEGNEFGRASSDNQFSQNADFGQSSSGWGQKTPSRNDNVGSVAWSGNETKDDSPARSQRSHQESYGRGRSRGGGRGGGKVCYKCNGEGHMARECPNSVNDERPPRGNGGSTCFKCNKEGHFARECPNMGSERGGRGGRGGRGRGRGGFESGGGRQCYKCQEEGHMAKDCPNDQVDRNRPFKRPRRDDGGGSYRRDNDDNRFQSEPTNEEGWGGTQSQNWDQAAQQNSNNDQNQEGGWN